MMARQAQSSSNACMTKTILCAMTESELELDIKRVFSPMYYERKRKRDEMENGD
jgi:hypothetical protein